MSTLMQQQVACNVTSRIVTFIATLGDETLKFKVFGNWIKDQRQIAGLSQEGAANKAGLSRYQWIRIENGQNGTKRSTVINMAKAVSGNTSDALQLAGYAPAGDGELPKPIIEAIAQSGNLTDQDFEMTANFIRMLNEQRAKID